jgi:hypothetical protein
MRKQAFGACQVSVIGFGTADFGGKLPEGLARELMDAYNCPDFTKTRVELDAHEAYRQVFENKREQVKIR